jgi:hypothetical protein
MKYTKISMRSKRFDTGTLSNKNEGSKKCIFAMANLQKIKLRFRQEFSPNQYKAYNRFFIENTIKRLSDFPAQNKHLIPAKNRLQNSHLMAFNTNLLIFLKLISI